MFNKGHIFESLAPNILFLCKLKLLSSIRTPKKVTLHISTEKHEDKLDKDGEAGEVSSIGQAPELQEPTASSDTAVFG